MFKKIASVLFSFSLLGVFTSANALAFTDVTSSAPYFEAVSYVQEKGLVSGYGDGSYHPSDLINRFDFTKIIIKARLSDENIKACELSKFSFPDVSRSEWYSPFVCAAKAAGIINGYGDGSFKGQGNVTLPEALKIILEAYDVDIKNASGDWYVPYLEAGGLLGITAGMNTGVETKITRADMAVLIFRIEKNKQLAELVDFVPPPPTLPVPSMELVNSPDSASQGETPQLNIYQSLDQMPDVTSFLTFVNRANAGGILSANGPFTLFAPSNEAFFDLPETTIAFLLQQENSEKLQSVINKHIFSGRFSIKDLYDGQILRTVTGESVTVSVTEDGKIYIGYAEIVQAGLSAENGIIHLIDQIYLAD